MEKSNSTMGIRSLSKPLVWAAIAIPLNVQDQWQVLKYRSLPAHKVAFNQKGLTIEVSESASPLIYPFPKVKSVKKVILKGNVDGQLNLRAPQKQGEKGADDFLLRLGLVTKGQRRLNFFQKLAAPQWIKTLYSLAPEGLGVDKILFLNMVQQKELLGKSRVHPLSDLIQEKFIWLNPDKKEFHLEYTLEKEYEVVAIWVSADGDDTRSKFTLRLNEIKFE